MRYTDRGGCKVKSLKARFSFPSQLGSMRGWLLQRKESSFESSQTAVTAAPFMWSSLMLWAAASSSLALQTVGNRTMSLPQQQSAPPHKCLLCLGLSLQLAAPLGAQVCLGVKGFVEIHCSLFTESITNIIKLNANAFEMQIPSSIFLSFALLKLTG